MKNSEYYDGKFGDDLTWRDAELTYLTCLFSVSNGRGESILKSLNIENGVISSITDAYAVGAAGGDFEITVNTNVDYSVAIQGKANDWLSYVKTKAIRTDVLCFHATQNTTTKFRSGLVYLTNEFNQKMYTFTIVQDMEGADNEIPFADASVKEACLKAFDADGDGVLTYREASQVKSLSALRVPESAVSFNELEYFAAVSEIPETMFYNCTSLESVVLPESIVRINEGAFVGCERLKTVNIPESVNEISYNVFRGCSSLESIVIPEGVESISSSLFEGCSSLVSVTIPKSVKGIGYDAFRDCVSLKSVSIPASAERISSGAFAGCVSLTEISIPGTVNEISESAFSGCSALETIVLPEGIATIEADLFNGCSSLSSVSLPNSLLRIEGYAFYGCATLAALNIPANVSAIGNRAFSASGLKSIVLPEGLTELGWEVFTGCSMLEEAELPESLTEFSESLFKGCLNLKKVTINSSIRELPRETFAGCISLSEVILPEGLESIGSDAFGAYSGYTEEGEVVYACKSLKSIVLPKSLTNIGDGAFFGSGLSGTESEPFVIPENVEEIRWDAFNGCANLNAVKMLPLTPPSIDWGAFPEGIVVLVPADALDAYSEASMWGEMTLKSY